MRTIALHQIDAFTNQIFGGNPAGVVSNADSLTENEMLQIAREMNLSETAFVLKPTLSGANIRLRFFTPTSEVDFCGHATIGTLSQLARLKMHGLDKQGTNAIAVETRIGLLSMSVTNKDVTSEVTFTAPDVSMHPYQQQGEEFAVKFGVPVNLLDSAATILIDQKLRYLYIPVAALEDLGKQSFDIEHIKQQFKDEGIVVFCLYTKETITQDADLHARGLAPLIGINEDPFTGSMQAGLVKAAKNNGYIPTGQEAVHTEQGTFIGRPGFAVVNHNTHTDTVAVSAQAVPVFSTNLEL